MNPHEVKSISYRNCTISILTDPDPANPRQEFDNFGTLAAFHKRYSLSDKNAPKTIEEAQRIEQSPEYVSLPVYLFDHSGLLLSTGDSLFRQVDPQGWDWGKLGIIYAAKSTILKAYNRKRMSRKLIAHVKQILSHEIMTLDDYLSGNVYGFQCFDQSGAMIDSCWGFYGTPGDDSYIVKEAKSAIDFQLDRVTGEQLDLFSPNN